MNTLIVAINAKYIHSSLAARCLAGAVKEFEPKILEFTINTPKDFILGEIFAAFEPPSGETAKEPAALCLPCYIWNICLVTYLVTVIKKILPRVKIICGGPEAAFDPERLLNAGADCVVCGEGEEILPRLLADLDNLPRVADGAPLGMDALPFAYADDIPKDKIIYYESSRGCPFRCKYCLSPATGGLRFLPLPRVLDELKIFLVTRVKQVKFVDRTFNADKSRALAIWKFLIENTNGLTNFHFEISADLLDSEALAVLRAAPKGLFQFEIGVQSTHEITLEIIDRHANFEKLAENVRAVHAFGNIHQHLDLIAGLPGENLAAFRKSFDDVFALEPEQLQLGFLKLLKGSALRAEAGELGIVAQDEAPYEVLYTRELSYADLRLLKGVEQMVETFYNSGMSAKTLKFLLEREDLPFDFFVRLWKFYKAGGYDKVSQSKQTVFKILYEFADRADEVKDLLREDFLTREYQKYLPDWLKMPAEMAR